MLQYKTAPVIETDRLIIRIVSISDAKDFFEFCKDPKVCTYLTFNPYKSVFYTKHIINNMINAYIHGTDANFSIIYKKENKVIGSISLHFFENENIGDVGYLLNSSYWNKGIMSEALGAFIKMSFDYYNFDALTASYISDNIASSKLLNKFNFKMTDYIENGLIKNTKNYDLVKMILENN